MARKIMKRNYDSEGNLISKECSCCHKVKPVSEFNKYKRRKDGVQGKCKKCEKKYREENKEYYQKYRKENKDKIKEYNQQYREENKDKIKEHREENKEYYQKYRKENKECHKEYYKEYYKDNSERIKERGKEYYKDNAERIKEYKTKKIQEALQEIKIEVEKNPEKYNYIEGKDIYGIIYLVHNIKSDKYYVGQTIRGFDNRYSSGWLYTHGYKNTVKHDLELYGEESFKYIKIFKVAYSQYELDKLEAYYIDYYNSYEKGYNENRGNIFTNRGKEDNK